MGCGSSNVARIQINSKDPNFVPIIEAWDQVQATVEKATGRGLFQGMRSNLVIRRTGWKTIRIFVSSTFKDFHQEREILVKKVFPNLRAWCEPRRLYLVECDLRWGVPKDYNEELTLKTCLGEIDRCREDNVMPFFLNMTSERIGWIPTYEQVPSSIKNEYKWIEGLSVTEMEILHGAYRVDNPNALFMMREDTFLRGIPDEFRADFIDGQEVASLKLQVLKDRIRQRVPAERLVWYHMEFNGIDPESQKAKLIDTDEKFSQAGPSAAADMFSFVASGVVSFAYNQVYNFFQRRIAVQYPLEDSHQDPYQHIKEQHEAFMKSRCDFVFGRDDVLQQIDSYVCTPANHVPLLLLGETGTGKSSVMCRAADQAANKALTGKIPGGGRPGWHVFYHFVGAVPGSTELFTMLKRLLLEMSVVSQANLPTSLDTAVQLTCGALTNVNTRPTIVIIDALNQFDEDQASSLVSWMPRKLAPHIRCVFSMIDDTPQHTTLVQREPAPHLIHLNPLTRHTRQIIVEQLLERYGKLLDKTQMCSLLDKESSRNPLWLSIAVEELRVYGNFRKVSEKIDQLADGLLELEIQVLERFEQESGGELLVATLSLLEVSARGLLETELLEMLADYDNLMPREDGAEKRDQGKEKAHGKGQLPAAKWAMVYGALRPFLRPFGESGEGRLDFYHRSLSKAVRKRYFNGAGDDDEVKRIYNWWHIKLADYFQGTGANIQRKIEEYPFHLIALRDQDRLEQFLVEWPVFNNLFDEEFSYKLIQFWRKGSNLERMRDCCMTSINNLANSPSTTKDELSRKQEEVAELLVQAGHYSQSKDLAEKAMKMEMEELGARPDRMAELHFLLGYVQDEEMKLEEYMYRSQLPNLRKIIDEYESCAKLRRQLTGDTNKMKLSRTLNRLSFYYSGYALRGGDNFLSSDEAKEKSLSTIESAIQMFKELDDEPHMADALVTKGVAFGNAVPEQLKAYKEALDLGLRVVGENHPTIDRLYLNMAIHYEEIGNYDLAYAHFRKWYGVCCELYGRQHPKTRRPISTLTEPRYRRLAEQNGDDVPEMPSEDEPT